MKKNILHRKNRMIGFVMLIVLLLCGCGKDKQTGELLFAPDVSESEILAYIQELNDNSNLGIALNKDSGLTVKEAKKYGNDHPYVITFDDKESKYYCFKYPLSDAPLAITQIEICDKEYDVLGIHLEDNVEDGITILQDYRYEKEDFPVDNAYKYVKGDINIILRYEGDAISKITVSLTANTEEG